MNRTQLKAVNGELIDLLNHVDSAYLPGAIDDR